jgi:hypothetical protein
VSGMITATRSPLHTALCDRLGIRYPICQAGMAFVARAELAAAVSAAGGLGVIAAAHGSPALLREEIRRLRELTDRPFGVDILFATIRTSGRETEPFTDAVRGWCDVALEERVPVLIAGLGNPGPLTAEAHRLGMTVMALCGNVKQSRSPRRRPHLGGSVQDRPGHRSVGGRRPDNHGNYHASPGASLALRAGSAEPRSTREGEARHLASPSSLLAPRVPHLTIAWVAVVVLDHRSSDLTLRNRRWTTQYGHKSLDSA